MESVDSADHLDQTLDGGLRRAQRHMTDEEVSKYLNGDWRIRIVKSVLDQLMVAH